MSNIRFIYFNQVTSLAYTQMSFTLSAYQTFILIFYCFRTEDVINILMRPWIIHEITKILNSYLKSYIYLSLSNFYLYLKTNKCDLWLCELLYIKKKKKNVIVFIYTIIIIRIKIKSCGAPKLLNYKHPI